MKAEEFYFKNYLNALYKAVIAEELNDEKNTENLENCESLSNIVKIKRYYLTEVLLELTSAIL